MAPSAGRAIMAREDRIVQKFDHRCPYCDQVIVYESFPVRPGENEITCPFCQKMFIKVVGDLPEEAERE
jgi:hypothetical protein